MTQNSFPLCEVLWHLHCFKLHGTRRNNLDCTPSNVRIVMKHHLVIYFFYRTNCTKVVGGLRAH